MSIFLKQKPIVTMVPKNLELLPTTPRAIETTPGKPFGNPTFRFDQPDLVSFPDTDIYEFVESQLEQHDILMVGEEHNQISTKRMLADMMPTFAEEGVESLLVEFAFPEHQETLDRYMKNELTTEELKQYLIENETWEGSSKYLTNNSQEYVDAYMDIFEQAREYGIRIVGIDSDEERYKAVSNTDYEQDWVAGGGNIHMANEVLNYIENPFAYNNDVFIAADNDPGKTVVWVGIAHLLESRLMQEVYGSDIQEGIMGMDDLVEQGSEQSVATLHMINENGYEGAPQVIQFNRDTYPDLNDYQAHYTDSHMDSSDTIIYAPRLTLNLDSMEEPINNM